MNSDDIGIFGIIGIIATLFSGAIGSIVLYLLKKREKQILQLTKDKAAMGNELQKAKEAFPNDLEIINDVNDVLNEKLLPIIIKSSANTKKVKIQNFGLDLETVMPWIKHRIVKLNEHQKVCFEIKSLIINPESNHVKDLLNGRSDISAATINSSIEAAKSLDHYNDLYKFSFEIKQYDLPPIFHGFLVNDEHLFLGFTEIDNGKLLGGTKPYLHLCKKTKNNSEITLHYFNSYSHWFYYYWGISKTVANVTK